ncbi:MAG: HAMP domain-containing histidine kinase [Caldisericaceae bacterium]|nr:HAMP domain-containing histidine kinase [Caldisericaceae bacterium]
MEFKTKLILSYLLLIIVVIFFALFFVNIYVGKRFSEIILKGFGGGYFVFLTPQGRLFLHAVRTSLIWAGIVSIVIGTLLALLISRFITTPLKEMEKFASKIARGNYNARIKITSDDEIGHLQSTLNKMAEHLSEIENMRKSLVQNVSHDLRTPLTSLKGYIEMLMDPSFSTEEKKKAIQVIKNEVDRMESMLEELSKLSTIDSKKYEIHLKRVNLGEAISPVTELMKMDAKSKGLYLHTYIQPDVFITADETRIKEIAINLISNAVKFTDKGGITVSVYKNKNKAYLSVKDTGKGIKKEDLTKIFDRFFRGEKSRPKTKGGLGVGLTIAKELTEAMNGKISVDSKVGKGTEFLLEFPLSK